MHLPLGLVGCSATTAEAQDLVVRRVLEAGGEMVLLMVRLLAPGGPLL
jgi:hypothetical protein